MSDAHATAPAPRMKRMPLWLRWMPRRGLSKFLGWIGRTRWGPLTQLFLRWYVKRYGADLSESERPLSAYRTFLAFFTRNLKPGLRPLPDDPLAIISPADGRSYVTGSINAGTLVQAKGVYYQLCDLLGDEAAAKRLEGGTYHVIYLAPGDYHRFHWPFDGTAQLLRHLPGDLWPVNERAVERVPGLFAVNERVAITGTMANGAPFAYVPVGALNVGSIGLEFHDVRTNGWSKQPREWPLDITAKRGDPFGWFNFGSSIVLCVGPNGGTLDDMTTSTPLRMGQVIGTTAP